MNGKTPTGWCAQAEGTFGDKLSPAILPANQERRIGAFVLAII